MISIDDALRSLVHDLVTAEVDRRMVETNDGDELMTVTEVRAMLGGNISTGFIRQHVPCVRWGSVVRWRRSTVRQWLRDCEQPARSA